MYGEPFNFAPAPRRRRRQRPKPPRHGGNGSALAGTSAVEAKPRPSTAPVPAVLPVPAVHPVPTVLPPWLRAQAANARRHYEALREFQPGEFGTTAAAPSEAHLEAANGLIGSLRRRLVRRTRRVLAAAAAATRRPAGGPLQRLLHTKEAAHVSVQAVERVWDFYFELFGQRQSRFGTWLLGCDRIALDCYQAAYLGLGTARSIPAPPPFSYMRTGFSPATFRRGIVMRRLGRLPNPFPLVQLPYHRLVNPWTL